MTLETHRFPTRLGGNLCLDFANTVEYRDTEHCLDFLHSYDSVLAWCWRSGLIDSAEAQRLAAIAARHPTKAASAYHAALELRTAFFHVFTALIAAETPANADLTRLNETLIAAPRRVTAQASGFTWAWVPSDDLAWILAPIALAAGELLTSDQLQWVRQCPNCGWLFVDTSRNHSRRWCSMEFCGSKIKSRRQYERRKTAQA